MRLRARGRSHGGAAAGEGTPLHTLRSGSAANLDRDRLPFGIRRNPTKAVLSTILEDESNRCHKAITRFVLRTTLTVRSGDLRAVRDHPVDLPLEHCRELVLHDHFTSR
jgi:hypothetical protein